MASAGALNDHYRLLGVSAGCTRDELRKAYYRKQLEFHTDKGGDLRICQQLNEAYRTLSDDEERGRYDTQRAEDGHGFEAETAAKRSLAGGDKFSDEFRKMLGKFRAEAADFRLQDGFFELYSAVLRQVAPIPHTRESVTAECHICLTSFLDNEEHARTAVGPYLDMFSLEEGSEPSLFAFLAQAFGDAFDEPPFELQSDADPLLLDEAWAGLAWAVEQVRAVFLQAPDGGFGHKIRRSRQLPGATCKWVVWAHGSRGGRGLGDILRQIVDQVEASRTKALEPRSLLNSVFGLVAYVQAQATATGIGEEEQALSWGQLANDMLDLCYPAAAVFLAKVQQLLSKEDVWLPLGMRFLLEFGDLVSAYSCFNHGSCDLEEIAHVLARQHGFHRVAIALLWKLKKFDKLTALATEFKDEDQVRWLYLAAYLRHSLSSDVHRAIDCLLQHLPAPMFVVAAKRLWLAHPQQLLDHPATHALMLGRLAAQCKTGLEFRQLLGAVHVLESARGEQSPPEETRILLESAATQVITAVLYGKEELSGLSDVLRFQCGQEAATRVWREKTNNGKLELRHCPGPYAAALHLLKAALAPSLLAECMQASHESPMGGTAAAAALLGGNPTLHRRAVLEGVNKELARLKRAAEAKKPIHAEEFEELLTATHPAAVCEFRHQLAGIDSLKIIRLGEVSLSRYATGEHESEMETAYSYLDLVMADVDGTSKVGALLMAMSYMLRAMETAGGRAADTYAFHKLLHDIAILVYQATRKNSTPYMLAYVQRLLFSMLLKANWVASQQIAEQRGAEGAGRAVATRGGQLRQSKTLHQLDLSEFYASLLRESIALRTLVPVQTSRMYSALDCTFLNFIGQQHLSAFLATKLRGDGGDSRDLPSHIYEYFALEGVWNGWLQDAGDGVVGDFATARERSMASLLAARGWSMDDVAGLMGWEVLGRTAEGWHDAASELHFAGEAYSRFYGVEVNERTAEIKLLLAKPSWRMLEFLPGPAYPPLFDGTDVRQVFSRRLHGAWFTLEEPDPPSDGLQVPMRSHPFQEARFEPRAQLCGSSYLATLLHADLLLKELTTGTEVSSQPPFVYKSASAGILATLPAGLRQALASPSERKRLEPKEVAHRFWIDVTDVTYDVPAMKGDVQRFEVGDVKVGVFTKRLTRDPITGRLVDDSEDDDETAETGFAKAMSENYGEVGLHFPVLLRIKELMKMSVCCTLLQSYVRKSEELERGADLGVPAVLDKLRSCVTSFPIYTETRVEECLSDCLRAQGVTASRVSNLYEARNKIQDELRAAERKVLENVEKRLCEDFHCEVAEVRSHLYSFLSGNGRARAALAVAVENGVKRKYRRICNALHVQLGMPLRSDGAGSEGVECANCAKGGKTGVPCCNWVPATFASAKVTEHQRSCYLKTLSELRGGKKDKEGNEADQEPVDDYLKNYRVYGGVIMCPNMAQGQVRTGVWERSFAASTVVGAASGGRRSGGGSSGSGSGSGPPPVHRNCNSYAGQQSHVYAILPASGGALKIGTSARGTNAADQSIRAETQARARSTRETYGPCTTTVLRRYNTPAEARAFEKTTILIAREAATRFGKPDPYPMEKFPHRHTKESQAASDRYFARCERKGAARQTRNAGPGSKVGR